MKKPTALVIGASGGLALELLKELFARDYRIIGTTRSSPPSFESSNSSQDALEKLCKDSGGYVIHRIDLEKDDAAEKVLHGLLGQEFGSSPVELIDFVYVVAGYFTSETFETQSMNDQAKTIQICALSPLSIITTVVLSSTKLQSGAKVVLITSEGGSIALRSESEGGGHYGHRMSKACENMMGKVLSIDLKPKGISVVMIHPGFLRTDMTARFSEAYDELGAVTPDIAVTKLLEVVDSLSLENTGRFISPMGDQGFNHIAKKQVRNYAIANGQILGGSLELPW
ncbi:hypothetical protein HK096_007966 [Nowakowskiella sp. JEL0078]|nr:hypothetical protein HK096_007966 [Nowakowskiella sp. JEL0078]